MYQLIKNNTYGAADSTYPWYPLIAFLPPVVYYKMTGDEFV